MNILFKKASNNQSVRFICKLKYVFNARQKVFHCLISFSIKNSVGGVLRKL